MCIARGTAAALFSLSSPRKTPINVVEIAVKDREGVGNIQVRRKEACSPKAISRRENVRVAVNRLLRG